MTGAHRLLAECWPCGQHRLLPLVSLLTRLLAQHVPSGICVEPSVQPCGRITCNFLTQELRFFGSGHCPTGQQTPAVVTWVGAQQEPSANGDVPGAQHWFCLPGPPPPPPPGSWPNGGNPPVPIGGGGFHPLFDDWHWLLLGPPGA